MSAMNAIVARRIVVRGRVQGVGFRFAAVDAAAEIGVTGWVRNCADGTVEILAQGTQDQVARMIAWAERGPPAARVSAVDVVEPPPDPALDSFEQRGTSW